MVLNIDVDGENAPSTLIATGREYDLIRGEDCATDVAVLAALPTLLNPRSTPETDRAYVCLRD
jgi:hypothetical protein